MQDLKQVHDTGTSQELTAALAEIAATINDLTLRKNKARRSTRTEEAILSGNISQVREEVAKLDDQLHLAGERKEVLERRLAAVLAKEAQENLQKRRAEIQALADRVAPLVDEIDNDFKRVAPKLEELCVIAATVAHFNKGTAAGPGSTIQSVELFIPKVRSKVEWHKVALTDPDAVWLPACSPLAEVSTHWPRAEPRLTHRPRPKTLDEVNRELLMEHRRRVTAEMATKRITHDAARYARELEAEGKDPNLAYTDIDASFVPLTELPKDAA